METNIEIEKLGAYAKTLQRTADHLLDNLERQMLQDAEDMAGRQRSNCPEDTGLWNLEPDLWVTKRVHRWTVSWVLCASMSLGLRIYPATDFAG